MTTGAIRFRVDPADVPPEKAARRLGLTLAEFQVRLPRLLSRGFPMADPDTGNFDLEAVDRWRHRRNAHLFPEEAPVLTAVPPARDARDIVGERLAAAKRG